MNRRLTLNALALAVSSALAMGVAVAQQQDTTRDVPPTATAGSGAINDTMAASDDREDVRENANDAQDQVNDATQVVEQMKRDPQLTRLLAQSLGVFIVPHYGKGAAVVGAQGGEGVLLVREGNDWSSPAFYNMGGISVGAQAGGAAGSIAILLMTDKAVNQFKTEKNTWSLDANAGLTVVNYSADAQASAGKGDVVLWSDTEGLFAGVSLGISDIVRDEEENRAYYNRMATAQEILSNSVTNPHARSLQEALPTQVAAR